MGRGLRRRLGSNYRADKGGGLLMLSDDFVGLVAVVVVVATGCLGRLEFGRVIVTCRRVMMMGVRRSCFAVCHMLVASAVCAVLLRSRRVFQLFKSRSATGSWRVFEQTKVSWRLCFIFKQG